MCQIVMEAKFMYFERKVSFLSKFGSLETFLHDSNTNFTETTNTLIEKGHITEKVVSQSKWLKDFKISELRGI